MNMPPARVWLYRRPPPSDVAPSACLRPATPRGDPWPRQNPRLRRLDPHRRARPASSPRSPPRRLALADAEVTTISLADYPLPIYNGDLEKEKGIPENAMKLARLIAAPARRLHRDARVQPFAAAAAQEHDRLGQPHQRRDARHPLSSQGLRHRRDVGRADRRRPRARSISGRCWRPARRAILVPEKVEISRAQDAFDEAGRADRRKPPLKTAEGALPQPRRSRAAIAE